MSHPNQRPRQRPDASGVLRLGAELDEDVLEALLGMPEDAIAEISGELGPWLRDRIAKAYRSLAAELSK